jgi:hypothetical protein
LFSRPLASTAPLFEFGFGLEPILHFMARLKAALEGSKVGEFCNQSVARSQWRRCDEPQWIERGRAIDRHGNEIPYRTGGSGIFHITSPEDPCAHACRARLRDAKQ